jgi:hypothetical protein
MGAFGSQNLSTNLTDFNTLDFYIDGKLLKINTIKICKITSVNDDGTVNVIPMVKRLNGKKEPLPSVELKGFPILRQQGGTSGFIIDYTVGDIVLVGFCDRDPQSVIRSKKEAAPSTYTPFPLSGGIVLGAVLFEDAQIYVRVSDKIYCVGDLSLTGNAEISGNAAISGDMEVSGNNEAASYSVGGTAGASLTFVDAGGTTHTVVNGIIVS